VAVALANQADATHPSVTVVLVTQTTLSFLCRHRRRCLRSHRPLCHFYVATGGGVFGHTDHSVISMSPQTAVSSVTQTTLSFLCRHRRRCLRSHRPLCHFYVATDGGVFGHTDHSVISMSPQAAVSSVTQTTLSFLCRHRRRCLRSHRPPRRPIRLGIAAELASYRTDAVLYRRCCISFVSRPGGGGVGHSDRNVLTCSEEHGPIPAGLALLPRPGGGGVGHSDRSEGHQTRDRGRFGILPYRTDVTSHLYPARVALVTQTAAHWLSVRSTAPSQPVLSLLSRPGGGGFGLSCIVVCSPQRIGCR
jgi:hypothetical protein